MTTLLWPFLLLIIFIGIFLIQDRWYHLRAEQRDYAIYARTIRYLRLHKMLEYIGIDLADYLHRMPRTEIDRHILQCSACKNLDICDNCLGERRCPVDMNFCPNYRSLIEHSHVFAPK